MSPRALSVVLASTVLLGCGAKAGLGPTDGGGGSTSSDAAGDVASTGAAGGTAGHSGAGGGVAGGGGTGTGGSTAIDCATVGCGATPICGEACDSPCGCCPCGEGQRQGDLVCHGGCWSSGDAGVIPPFTSFRISTAYGPCPPGGDCAGYLELDHDATLTRDPVGAADAGTASAKVTAMDLAEAELALTAPALVAILDGTKPACEPPTDVLETMKLVDDEGAHENDTTTCNAPPIEAARDAMNALGAKYLPVSTP